MSSGSLPTDYVHYLIAAKSTTRGTPLIIINYIDNIPVRSYRITLAGLNAISRSCFEDSSQSRILFTSNSFTLKPS